MGVAGLAVSDAMTRLSAIADLVPREAVRVADIGYDHGKLLVHLARSTDVSELVGVEQQAEAPARFWRRYGADALVRSRVQLLLGDGLHPLADREVETIVIAGLGEKSIVDMLTASREVLCRVRRLVLSPVGTKGRGLLRQYLRGAGWAAVDERLVLRKGRYYQAYAAEPGAGEIDEDTWLFGTQLFAEHHPLLLGFLDDLRTRHAPLVEHHPGSGCRVSCYCRRLLAAMVPAGGAAAESA